MTACVLAKPALSFSKGCSMVNSANDPYSYPHIKLNRFHKDINLVMNRIFRLNGFNVTREQEAILRALVDFDGVNQAELATRVGQERNNLSRTLVILEKKGLISRKVCEADKRNSLVYLTPQGRALHGELHQAMQQYREVLFGNLTRMEIDSFSGYIQLMTQNLEHFLEASQDVATNAKKGNSGRKQD